MTTCKKARLGSNLNPMGGGRRGWIEVTHLFNPLDCRPPGSKKSVSTPLESLVLSPLSRTREPEAEMNVLVLLFLLLI